MKVENMASASGNPVANQFLIHGAVINDHRDGLPTEGVMYQSYDSNIAFRTYGSKVYIDSKYWDYSATTGKYRNMFLGEKKQDTLAKIKSGEYILANLND